MKRKFKKGFSVRMSVIFCLAPVLFVLSVNACFAEMEIMSRDEMKKETAQAGLASFSLDGNTTRLFMDIHLETWTEIESAKIGYYSRNNSTGWDQDWTDISIGTQTVPLQMDGMIFKADFDNVNAANPVLKRIVIGTNRLNGSIGATLNSFSGVYKPSLTGETTTQVHDRSNLSANGSTVFNFSSDTPETADGNEGFFLVITPPGTVGASHPGIQVVAGYSETTIQSAFSAGEWWDKP